MNIRKQILLFVTCALISGCIEAKTIVWDLGGVLFKPKNKLKIALQELSIGSLIGHMFLDFKSPWKLKKKAFAVLNRFGTQTGPVELRLKDLDGKELPQLFVDVLLGNVTHQEALEQSTNLINDLYQQKIITTKREKKLLLGIMRTMFDSQTFIKHMYSIPGAAALVAACASDQSCTQYVLSNWDAHSFALLHESAEGQKVFKHITPENIVISGACHLAKPDPAIFKHLIDTHNLDPKECMFIDDTYENILSAQACGFNTIYFHKMSHSDLKKLLIKKGFLFAPAKDSISLEGCATI